MLPMFSKYIVQTPQPSPSRHKDEQRNLNTTWEEAQFLIMECIFHVLPFRMKTKAYMTSGPCLFFPFCASWVSSHAVLTLPLWDFPSSLMLTGLFLLSPCRLLGLQCILWRLHQEQVVHSSVISHSFAHWKPEAKHEVWCVSHCETKNETCVHGHRHPKDKNERINPNVFMLSHTFSV